MIPSLPFQRYCSIHSYLQAIRHVVFSPIQPSTERIILVMGNPSADLDSFISAITYSYFHNHRSNTSSRGAIYIPLLNMPKTPSSDLWRLRPEFGVALRLAAARYKPSTSQEPTDEQVLNETKHHLSPVLTIKDLLDSDLTRPDLKQIFRPDLSESNTSSHSIPLILVDHNAPSISIPKIPTSAILPHLSLEGCIDHHVDEHIIPSSASPRVITTGIGSCTTIVVSYLRQQTKWPKILDAEQATAVAEMCHLALAPILVDTHNLKATGEKCSDLDRAIVAVLQNEMSGGASETIGVRSSWNRDDFYEPITAAKGASLDLLTPQEMFERDYKSWVEGEVEIGIASLVRPISWLVKEKLEGGAGELAREIKKFAERMQDEQTNDGVWFEVFVLLTPGDKEKGKEVLWVGFSERARRAMGVFEQRAGELRLENWDGDGVDEVERAFKEVLGEDGGCKVWWMTNREKTRKQGAPLVREAVRVVQEQQQ